MFLNHKVAASYAMPIIGEWNEPETHEFLDKIITKLSGTVEFVDVGANVGEMVVDVSKHKKVRNIVAFEPVPECAKTIEKSICLNGFDNCRVVAKLVGEKNGLVAFSIDNSNTVGSSIYETGEAAFSNVLMTRLDDEDLGYCDHLIILIDVEGYEPFVLNDGIELITARKPLIIFEYNLISKRYFNISKIQEILGERYTIYRLRSDGNLDSGVDNAWNCVAVPHDSAFEPIASCLVCAE